MMIDDDFYFLLEANEEVDTGGAPQANTNEAPADDTADTTGEDTGEGDTGDMGGGEAAPEPIDPDSLLKPYFTFLQIEKTETNLKKIISFLGNEVSSEFSKEVDPFLASLTKIQDLKRLFDYSTPEKIDTQLSKIQKTILANLRQIKYTQNKLDDKLEQNKIAEDYTPFFIDKDKFYLEKDSSESLADIVIDVIDKHPDIVNFDEVINEEFIKGLITDKKVLFLVENRHFIDKLIRKLSRALTFSYPSYYIYGVYYNQEKLIYINIDTKSKMENDEEHSKKVLRTLVHESIHMMFNENYILFKFRYSRIIEKFYRIFLTNFIFNRLNFNNSLSKEKIIILVDSILSFTKDYQKTGLYECLKDNFKNSVFAIYTGRLKKQNLFEQNETLILDKILTSIKDIMRATGNPEKLNKFVLIHLSDTYNDISKGMLAVPFGACFQELYNPSEIISIIYTYCEDKGTIQTILNKETSN